MRNLWLLSSLTDFLYFIQKIVFVRISELVREDQSTFYIKFQSLQMMFLKRLTKHLQRDRYNV